mgnify:CR=1 FL=1
MFRRAKKIDAEEVTSEVEEEKPSSKRRIVIIGLAVGVLCAGAASGYFYFLAGGETAGHETEAKAGDGSKPAAGKDAVAHSAYVVSPFKEIIVNITSTTANGQATSRFLKLNVALVYDPKVDGADRLAERQLFIRDAFVDYLRQLNENDLKGSAGMAQLKADLLHRVRVLGETEAPRELLIADMVIQ